MSEKPPAHPNTYLLNCGSSSSASGGSGSYSVIGQKRRELLQQRVKLNSGGSSSCSSSAGTASGSGSSALNDRLLNSPKSNSINIKIDVSPSLQQQQQQQLPLNRMPSFTSSSPLQSPNQFFPMPISNSSQSSSSFTNSNNSNNNNNFTNLKYVNEGNYRDYGSGLGDIAEIVENKFVLPYSQIPDFPRSTGNLSSFIEIISIRK